MTIRSMTQRRLSAAVISLSACLACGASKAPTDLSRVGDGKHGSGSDRAANDEIDAGSKTGPSTDTPSVNAGGAAGTETSGSAAGAGNAGGAGGAETDAETETDEDAGTPPAGEQCDAVLDYTSPPDQIADTLALSLWNDTPDDELLAAAASGDLSTSSGAVAQIERMLADPRAVAHLGGFGEWWLGLPVSEGFQEYRQSIEPTFTPEAYASIQSETELFTRSVLIDPSSTLSTFFGASHTFVDEHTAGFYGIEAPAGGFSQVDLPAQQRAGILTQLRFLSAMPNHETTNPALRGYFVRRRVLCTNLPAPPEPVEPPPPLLTPEMTTRQRLEAIYQSQVCAVCHDYGAILGYAFENFDTFGRVRETDNGQPVDTTTRVLLPDETLEFAGAPDMLRTLATRREAQDCFAEHWLAFLLGREPLDTEAFSTEFTNEALEAASCAIEGNAQSIRGVITQLASATRFIDGTFPCGPKRCLRDTEQCWIETLDADDEVTRHHCGPSSGGCRSPRDCGCEDDERGAVTLRCDER